jgi:acetyl-CoA synthetase
LVFSVLELTGFALAQDIGWVTGHSYIVYGPLSNASTTFMFESTPLFPDASRYWACVERHKISIFYTAPTAIRALMKFGEEPVRKHDLSSLRVLGSVGEPINPEVLSGSCLSGACALHSSVSIEQAWRWYHRVVGGNRCPIADTFWQTETGGHMLTPLPFATPTKPGSATLPFFGVQPALLEATTGAVLSDTKASGVLVFTQSWPGMSRTIYRDHARFLTTYLSPYPGYYFTGDGADRDEDGYYWITGRVDDVMNISGHRIGSAEVESALVLHPAIAEAAVIGIPHDIKGTSMFAYVIPKQGFSHTPQLVADLKAQVCVHLSLHACAVLTMFQ